MSVMNDWCFHHSTAPFPILVMPSDRLGNDKYTFLSHCLDSIRVLTHAARVSDLPKQETCVLLIQAGITSSC